MTDRSVLLASNCNAWPEAFNGQAYAFLNVIRQIEDAELLCPPADAYTEGRGVKPSIPFLVGELKHRAVSQLMRSIGRPGSSNMQPVTVDRDYDLFMFMCQFPVELGALQNIRDWRKRSKVAVCYILETWPNRLPLQKAELRQLDQFDHVFVLNSASIPNLRRYTSAPVSFLATAADTLLATPLPEQPDRGIDVYSMGRRAPDIHDQLLKIAETDNRFFYLFDTLRNGNVGNWHEHRLVTAEMIKRSRFFMAYDFSIETSGILKNVNRTSLSTRYFEGAAGGAVILGTGQTIPDYHAHFDWEDIVIEMPQDTADVRAFLADLMSQEDRLASARVRNAVQSLRRHDWAHRWADVLRTLGMAPQPMLQERLDRLSAIAASASHLPGYPNGKPGAGEAAGAAADTLPVSG